MQRHKIEKLLVVDNSGALNGLITVEDVENLGDIQQRYGMSILDYVVEQPLVSVGTGLIVLLHWSKPVWMYSLSTQHTATPEVF